MRSKSANILIDRPKLTILNLVLQNYNNKIALMSKQSAKKYRHNSLIDVPFTQRTAYFKQDTDPYRTLPSKSALKTLLQQTENTPLQNKHVNNENQCLKNIQDKLLGQKKHSLKKVANNCLKEITKSGNEFDNMEKRIDNIIEKKMKRMIESCVQRYFSKFLQGQKEFLHNYHNINDNQTNARLMKIQKGYDDILRTYDSFLIIAQKIKDKAMKYQKYVKKTDLQTIIKKNEAEMIAVQSKLQMIASELQALKKSDLSLSIDQDKLKPVSLKYNEAQEFGVEELRIVVNTYNENFMQIDQKLQELYSYFT